MKMVITLAIYFPHQYTSMYLYSITTLLNNNNNDYESYYTLEKPRG